MAAGETEYRYPPISLLHESQGENHMAAGAELRNNSRRLAETLSSFGVDAKAGKYLQHAAAGYKPAPQLMSEHQVRRHHSKAK